MQPGVSFEKERNNKQSGNSAGSVLSRAASTWQLNCMKYRAEDLRREDPNLGTHMYFKIMLSTAFNIFRLDKRAVWIYGECCTVDSLNLQS